MPEPMGAPQTPSEARTDASVMDFQRRARAYLRRTGRFTEDVLSEMVCLALEYGERPLNMDLLYLQACDRLDPRRQLNGTRTRLSARTVDFATFWQSDDAGESWQPSGRSVEQDVLLRQTIARFSPTPRAIFTRLLDGETQAEIAGALGLTESAISLTVRRWLPHVRLHETLPTTDTYTFACATCGQEKTVHASGLVAELPLYCSRRCLRGQNNVTHQALREVAWRKYTFTDAMNTTIIQTVRRGRRGALKQLWQDDRRFRAAGIPYPILKRQARKLGLVRTLPQMKWQAEELAIVESLLRQGYSTEVVVRKLAARGYHRSAGGVQELAWQHQWGRRRSYYTMLDVMVGFGIDHHAIRRWVTKGWLTVQPHPHRKTSWRISLHALRQFLRGHPEEVAKGAPDVRWLIGLLTPTPHGARQVPAEAVQAAAD